MEFQKIINLMIKIYHDKDLPRYVTKKWIEVYDQSEKNYNINKENRFKTMLRSDLCDFSDVCIVVKGNITVSRKTFTANDFVDPNNTDAIVTATNNANNNAFHEKKIVFKNNTPFINVFLRLMAQKSTMQKT